ncbi:MAG: hypothetical protein D6718_12995 [Acidobacteria bacterium]|nr:MAG: hypothetical protein D6718_12995 [Acidobacteriota bacterium]
MLAGKVVGFLGKRRYEPTDYYLEERPEETFSSRFSPVALAKLIGAEQIHVLATPMAQDAHGSFFEEEAKSIGVPVTFHDFPEVQTAQNFLWKAYERIVDFVQESGGRIHFDITYGYRFFPFLGFAAFQQLASEVGSAADTNFELAGLRYGAYEAGTGGRTPLVDLSPAIQLLEAAYAARFFAETGSPAPLARILTSFLRTRPGHEFASVVGPVAGRLEELGPLVASALPIDAGRAAAGALNRLEDAKKKLPAYARRLVSLITPTLERIALSSHDPDQPPLSETELIRELKFAEVLLEHGDVSGAYLVLEEWFLNRAILALGEGATWLDYEGCREKVRRRFNALARRLALLPTTNEPWKAAVSHWQAMRDRRNAFAHAGFREKPVSIDSYRHDLEQLLEFARANVDRHEVWRLEPDAELDSLLITALGLSPGVLYTALTLFTPNLAVVVTSHRAEQALEEACRRAQYCKDRVRTVVVDTPNDPRACIRAVRAAGLEDVLADAREVVLNLTGGPTAFQIACEDLARRAESLGAAVRRIILVDDRPREEQERNPWALGQAIELDGDSSSGISEDGSAS